MKTTTAMIAVAVACLITACGLKRIEKLPVPPEDRIRAIRFLAEGDELLRDEKEHLAMVKYLEATRLNPYDERAFNKLAIAYIRLGMYYVDSMILTGCFQSPSSENLRVWMSIGNFLRN